MTSRKSLQRAIVVLGMIPVVTGVLSLALGSAIIPGGDSTSNSVESELRFYAAFWVGFGLYLISLAPRIEQRGRELRAACGVLVLGAVGRAVAIADAGSPRPWFVVLMALEVLLPAVLVLWQARVATVSRDDCPSTAPRGS